MLQRQGDTQNNSEKPRYAPQMHLYSYLIFADPSCCKRAISKRLGFSRRGEGGVRDHADAKAVPFPPRLRMSARAS